MIFCYGLCYNYGYNIKVVIGLRYFNAELAEVAVRCIFFFIYGRNCLPTKHAVSRNRSISSCKVTTRCIQKLVSELKIQKSTLFKAVLISMTLLAVTSYPSSIVIEGTGMTCWRISEQTCTCDSLFIKGDNLYSVFRVAQ